MPYMLPMFAPYCNPENQDVRSVFKELRARCRRSISLLEDTHFSREIKLKRYWLRVNSLIAEMERWGFNMPHLEQVKSYLFRLYQPVPS